MRDEPEWTACPTCDSLRCDCEPETECAPECWDEVEPLADAAE